MARSTPRGRSAANTYPRVASPQKWNTRCAVQAGVLASPSTNRIPGVRHVGRLRPPSSLGENGWTGSSQKPRPRASEVEGSRVSISTTS